MRKTKRRRRQSRERFDKWFAENAANHKITSPLPRKMARDNNNFAPARKGKAKKRSRGFTKGYIAHIHSEKWRLFRAAIIGERGPVCERCGAHAEGLTLHLHHLTYVRLGYELPKDVQLICKPCHQAEHPHRRIA